jgi:hypothetical protein
MTMIRVNPTYLSKADGTMEYRMIQSMRFAVKVSKAYDNSRYPPSRPLSSGLTSNRLNG